MQSNNKAKMIPQSTFISSFFKGSVLFFSTRRKVRRDHKLISVTHIYTFIQMDNSKDTDSETRKCLVGICCMDAKGRSKHMLQILNRLEVSRLYVLLINLKTYGNFQMVFFGDDTILNKPTQEWPEVDVLLTF